MTGQAPAAPGGVLARYEAVIGIEVHCQLRTLSKMFCPCSTEYDGAPPNSHCCPVCLGLPGALPTINRQAVEHVLATGLALDAAIPEATRWDRKNYFYPDLPKGYQISQYDLPLASMGRLGFETSDGPVTISMSGMPERLKSTSETRRPEASVAWISRAVSSSRWARRIPTVNGPSEVSIARWPFEASGRSYWLIW